MPYDLSDFADAPTSPSNVKSPASSSPQGLSDFSDAPPVAKSDLSDFSDAPQTSSVKPWVPLRSDEKLPHVASQPVTPEDAAVVQQAQASGKPVIMVNGRPTIGEKPENPPLSAGDRLVQGAESALGTTALRVGAGLSRLGASATTDTQGNTDTELADSLAKNAADFQKQQPTDTASKIGQGVGGAAGLIASGGLPGAMTSIGLQSQAEKLSFGSALKAAPELAAYWLLGMGAGKLVGPLVKQSSPLVKTLASSAAATGANMVSSATIRALNGQPVMPDADSLAQDALFGFGAHGMEAGREAIADHANVKAMLENAPDDALKMAASDPDFRKSAPYDPALIDAELKRREDALPASEKIKSLAPQVPQEPQPKAFVDPTTIDALHIARNAWAKNFNDLTPEQQATHQQALDHIDEQLLGMDRQAVNDSRARTAQGPTGELPEVTPAEGIPAQTLPQGGTSSLFARAKAGAVQPLIESADAAKDVPGATATAEVAEQAAQVIAEKTSSPPAEVELTATTGRAPEQVAGEERAPAEAAPVATEAAAVKPDEITPTNEPTTSIEPPAVEPEVVAPQRLDADGTRTDVPIPAEPTSDQGGLSNSEHYQHFGNLESELADEPTAQEPQPATPGSEPFTVDPKEIEQAADTDNIQTDQQRETHAIQHELVTPEAAKPDGVISGEDASTGPVDQEGPGSVGASGEAVTSEKPNPPSREDTLSALNRELDQAKADKRTHDITRLKKRIKELSSEPTVAATEEQRIADGTKRVGDTFVAKPESEAPKVASEAYLESLKPLQRGKAKGVLETQLRTTSGEIKTRAQIIEDGIANGATLGEQTFSKKLTPLRRQVLKGEQSKLFRDAVNDRVTKDTEHPTMKRMAEVKKMLADDSEKVAERSLNSIDGSFRTAKEITSIGLDYAEHLLEKASDQKTEAPAVDQPKEPWQKTRDEVKAEGGALAKHGFQVQEALKQGKPVPLEVLESFDGRKWADDARRKLYGADISPTAFDKILKKLESDPGTQYSDPLFIQSVGKPLLRAAVKVAREAMEAGKVAADAVNDAITYLKANVKNLDEDKAREFFDPASRKPKVEKAEERALPGMEKPKTEAQPDVTGIRNVIVDEERTKRDIPEREAPLRRTFGAVWDEAKAAVEKNPDAGTELVDSLRKQNRPLTDREDAILTHEQLSRQQAFDRAVDRVNNATDDAERTQAQAQLNTARDKVYEIYDVGQKTGTANARGLNARRLLVQHDYSLAKMEARARAANNGKPLEQKQLDQLKEAHDKIAELEKKVAEHEEKQNAAQAKHYFDQLSRETGKDRSAATKTGKGLGDFLSDQAAKARERIKSRGFRFTAGLDPADLIDHGIIGADYIAKGVSKLADWSKAMIRDFGEGIRPYIVPIFEKAKEFHDANKGVFEKAKPKEEKSSPVVSENGELDHRTVYDIARKHVLAGVEGFDAVMKATHEELKATHPEFTERQVRDAFSEYGKTKFPSKEQDKMKLAEYRRIGQLVSAIEDATKGEAPKKTGMQRDKPTQDVRAKMAELRAAMDQAGIETQSPEEQLASRNQARATALRNSIEDLDKRLKTGEKPPKGTPVADTPEVESLRAERDAMKAQLKEIEDLATPKPTGEEIASEQAQSAVDRAAAALDRQQRINSGEIKPEAKEKVQPLSDLEKELRDKTEELRNAKREADAAKQKSSPEEAQAASAQKGVDAAAAALDRWDRILKGEITPESKTPAEVKSALEEEMRSQVEAMKQAHRELKAASRPKTDSETAREQAQLKALEKSITEYERRAREVDLEPRGKRQGPDTAKIANAKVARDAAKKVVDDLREAAKIKRTPEQIRLDTYKKTIASRTQDLQDRIAKGDYTKRTPTKTVLDSEAEKLKADYARAKQKMDFQVEKIRLANRTRSQKFWDGFVGIERAMKLTSDVVLGKLTTAAVVREGILTPAEELVGGAISKVLPRLAERAPREGGFSLDAEMQAKAALFTKGMQDAWQNLKMQRSDLEASQGRPEKAVPAWYEYMGFLHGALKAPIKRAEFTRSLTKRMAAAARDGEDVNNPGVMQRLAAESYVDANRSIFLQDNFLSTEFNATIGRMEKSKKAPNLGPATARLARFLVPIVKVPTNIVGEVATGVHGTATGSVRAAHAYLKGIEKLPPEQADAILRQLKKGLVGNAMLLFGYLAYQNIGGFYVKGDKRRKSDVQPGRFRVGGVDLPSVFSHSTGGMLMEIGATIAREEKKKGLGDASISAASGLAKQLPFVPAVTHGVEALDTDQGFHNYINSLVASSVTPAIVQHAAKVLDTPGSLPSNLLDEPNRRNPKTLVDSIKSTLPGLRQQVPNKKN